ncbi:hypothetical protein C7C46_06605 [Streptomyces tateyamensis]|uniref:Uncharacterized protein n=1 Tax=Streptomyces tateyamensis TaxID=565073 RepID=A0A2V4NIE0_9ACTN|nr:hypothetical protein [Streptomyces tateyamensis]PYC85407.1 hypothetical protein C7C46_06605 [Streptomyces tateyamensis]
MSTVHRTAPPAAAKTPRARTTDESAPDTLDAPAGATLAPNPRRRRPLATAVRNVGIALDTAARVVFLGRDGVKY